MSRHCPKCGDPLSAHGECGSCGFGRSRTNSPASEDRRRFNEQALAASRARPGPTSLDLTEKQWYAVCKFWPGVAKRASDHCGRRLADVGPHNPLDSQVKRGAIFTKPVFDFEAAAERDAIQNERRAAD